VVCPTPAPQMGFQEYVRAVSEHQERLQRLETELREQVQGWRLAPVVQALQAMRRVQFRVVVTLIAKRSDLSRIENPRPLMSSLGLTPSEYSSGERRRQGSITTAGHTFARRALIEGPWAYRYPAKVSRHLQWRLAQLPQAIQNIGWKAQVRLCQRFRYLTARGKHANQVVVAIARDMAACIWAIAREVHMTREAPRPRSEPSCYRRYASTIGREAAAVWRHARRREAAARNPRASIEAGARRTQVRWYPTHGYQHDQPS
jgi:transposase